MTQQEILEKLKSGLVIPAHPLALTDQMGLDERRQRALSRYYLCAGAGGLAVGVHTTQFAIHDPEVGLYGPVLELAVETAARCETDGMCERPLMIAGIVGDTKRALAEAELAKELGYDMGLLSLTALKGKGVDELIAHARNVAEVIPIMGFYLQQTISGMVLQADFWRRLVEIPQLLAIKIAPFNRYQSLDVLEAVAASGRADEIALYTGNDDNIVVDLLTSHQFSVEGRDVRVAMVGGLLGQWACWTRRAVEQLAQIREIRRHNRLIDPEMLTLASQMTLANKAIFDADNSFAGCIPGISYVLQKQGLLANTLSLQPAEVLSTGQAEMIDRIIRDYPHLTDNEFVAENLDRWLA